MEPRHDVSQWPVVIITMAAEPATDVELQSSLDRASTYFARRERFGMVVDDRLSGMQSAQRRRTIAEWMDRELAQRGQFFAGMAVVLTSTTQRAVFKTISWLRQSPHPMAAFATVEEGVAWLNKKLTMRSEPAPRRMSL
jgi:hypothetical protein